MATHVYANDLEIAGKAADGKAPVAFPDVCISPGPPPPPGGLPIPYPNTAFAKDITNGTSTVFICGKEVAIEDKSYFSTSTGDEPATEPLKKGIATTVLKGKAYFQAWSPDVVFEGFCVPRHTDLTSHNHASMPSNTPLFPYASRSFFGGHDCEKEEDRIERACKKEADDSDTRREIRSKSKIAKLLKRKGRKRNKNAGNSRRDGSGWHWTDDHCDGLHVSLSSAAKAQEYAKELEEVFKSLPEELNILDALKETLTDMQLMQQQKLH